MAVATLAYTTAGTTLNKNYRKIQGKMIKVFNSDCEEWDLIDDIPTQDITISAREMTVPVDVKLQGGTASIPEAGHEANPWTVALNEVTLTWVNLNQRWTTSLTAKYLDKKSAEGQVFRQLKYQAMKAMEGLSNRVGQMFYGFSTGLICKTTTAATATTHSLTLIDAYGDSNLDDAGFLTSFFVVGDQIALVNGSSLVTNGIGEITAINATTGVLTVVFAGSVESASGYGIYFANGAINSTASTLDAGSDYNRWPVGLKDAAESVTVHSLANTTEANWDAALVNTSGGSYSFLKERKARQALHNKGKAKAELCIWANGVENDVIVNERGAVMFSDALNMTFDGSIKTKGLTRFTSRKVPNGHVFLLDKDAIGKIMLLPKPSEAAPAWADGDKAEDRNALKFSVDFPFAFVVRKRRGIAEYRGLTEQ
jgi:hypothetical protein